MLASESYGAPDHGLAFAPDYGADLGFEYGYDHALVIPEDWFLLFEGGRFHTYRIESADMLHYTLWLDGLPVHAGEWFDGYTYSYVAFGDGCAGPGGGRSVTIWDYMRFGVVPEPRALFPAVYVGIGVCGVRRRF
jgi:hypothetical protein